MMAGTRVVRTTNVSSSTPNATAKPIWSRPRRLPLIMLAKVPAMMMPAEVMMPPVRAKRLARAVAGAVGGHLLLHPPDEEDVVVHAQGHQHDEHEHRHPPHDAGVAQMFTKSSRTTPSVAL